MWKFIRENTVHIINRSEEELLSVVLRILLTVDEKEFFWLYI